MIATFWSGLAGKLADRTALVLLGPATAFWAVGFLAWAGPHPLAELRSLATPASGQPQPIQLALIAVGLAVLLGSAVVAERLTPTALKVMAGDWPRGLGKFRRRLAARQFTKKEALETRWEELYPTVAEAGPGGGAAETDAAAVAEEELLDVERRLSGYPARSQRVAPTRLGNVLRGADSRVLDKYGLDSARCWPALWLLVPDIVRDEVGGARKALDTATLWCVWSALLAIWLVFDLRVIVLVVIAVLLAYRSAISAAARYGELVDAAYTLHRGLLYDAAGWPRPDQPDGDEVSWGRALTMAFWRGPALAGRPGAGPPEAR